MPETAVKTRDQIAADQIQFILRQDWFQPETLKKYIGALKNWQPNQLSVIIDGQITSYNRIVADLQQFLRSLPPDRRQNLAADGLAPDQLDLLDSIIDEVAGLASPEPAAEAGPSSANIPPDLKALVEQFEKANQASISAQSKRQGWSPEEFRKQIALQNQITIQMHQVRNYTLSQLQLAVDNSATLENLAAALGRRPEVVKRLAKIHLQTLVDKHITAQTFRQARTLIKDPVQLAAYYTDQLKKDILSDDLLSLAAADRHPQTKKNNIDAALKNIKTEAAAETAKAQPAIEAAAKNLEEHPAARKAAQKDAVAAVKQVDSQQQLKPAATLRLAEALARHPDNLDRQERIIRSALGATSSQAKIIRGQLAPQINQLAKSSVKPNYLAMADPDSIFNDISLHPNRFPRPLVDAVRSGRISDPGKLAEAIIVSRTLNIPLEAVVLSQWGIDAQKLAGRWQQGPKFLWIIPMGHDVDLKDPDIVKLTGKLTRLAPAQKQLADSLKAPPPLLPPQIPRQFLKTATQNSRAVRLNQFTENLNPFRLFTAISYNLNRIPSISSIGNAGSGFFSGLQVRSPAVNFIFNAYNTFTGGIPQIPSIATSFITSPFRAVGSAISNTIINPVKTWANTQIKSGLTRAGAWLAKKGVTAAAKKVGMALLGKGTAALLAQAIPVVGQVVGVLTLLSALGDIGKFLWANRKEIGFGLAGMFFLGQMLLTQVMAFLGTAAWTLGGALIGGLLFGPIGIFVGGAIGWLIGSGALGSALAGLGSALGSAAAGLSSFLGALTAPSLVAGLGSTIATAGLLGVGAAWAIQTFFIQPNINSALYVAPDYGSFPPGGPIPPGCPAQIWPVTVNQGQQYKVSQGPGGGYTHGPPCITVPGGCVYQEAVDINPSPQTSWDPNQHLIVATHPGTVIRSTTDPNGGNYIDIQDTCGGDFRTRYVHMSVNYVTAGQTIQAGDIIGVMGNTGWTGGYHHLHYAFMNANGTHKSRIDPPPFLVVPYIPKDIPQYCVGVTQCNVLIP